MVASVVFRSANVLARSVPAHDETRWVVTFDNYGSPASFDRPGFGEEFFRSRRISVLSVIGRGNDWYQYDDMLSTLRAIRERVGGADRIMTYGSSMGGYAAIRFADAVGAHACLALSPQYSIDPAKVPFEWRWPQEAGTIAWRSAIDGPISCAIRPVVIFDPHGADGQQASRIACDISIAAVKLAYTAHPVTTFLSSARLLEQAVMSVLDGSFDAADFQREALARRRNDPVYLSELSRLQPARRRRLAIALARRALALAPESDLMLHTLARQLTAAGAHDEALPLHERAVRSSGSFVGYLIPYSSALLAAGQLSSAVTVARELVDRFSDSAENQGWLGHLLWMSGHREEALERARRACDLAPASRHHRDTLARYLRQSRTPPSVHRARRFASGILKRLRRS